MMSSFLVPGFFQWNLHRILNLQAKYLIISHHICMYTYTHTHIYIHLPPSLPLSLWISRQCSLFNKTTHGHSITSTPFWRVPPRNERMRGQIPGWMTWRMSSSSTPRATSNASVAESWGCSTSSTCLERSRRRWAARNPPQRGWWIWRSNRATLPTSSMQDAGWWMGMVGENLTSSAVGPNVGVKWMVVPYLGRFANPPRKVKDHSPPHNCSKFRPRLLCFPPLWCSCLIHSTSLSRGVYRDEK